MSLVLHPRRALGAVVATSLATLPGCLSPEEYREQADQEVYALVDARRKELFAESSPFSIERDPERLRQQILEGNWDPTPVLSLEDCLEIAASNSRDYQTQKERLYRAALDLTFERWRFQNRPFASLGGSVDGVGNDTAAAETNGGVGFSRLLGTGASLVTDIGASLFRVVSTGDGWDSISDVGFSFTQPLMRGMGERIVKEPLTQAERDLVYAVRDFERFRRTFAVDVAGEVYALLQSVDEIANEEKNYQELLELRERNEALAEAGRLSRIESDQAFQDELRSESRLLQLRATLERQLDDFNFFLGLPIDTDIRLDPSEFEKLDSDDDTLARLDEELAIEYALNARLDFLTTLDGRDDSERQVHIAADALRAGLSLDVNSRTGTIEGRPVSYRLDDTVWSAGLSLDLPLDRVAERNAYRSSLISLEAADRAVEQEGDSIRAGVRDALRVTSLAQKDYEIQEGAVELAERRVESALLNLDAGRASTRDVLEAHESLVDAENALTTALIEFTLARLDLYLRLELLRVDESGIRIEQFLGPTEDDDQ